MTPFAARVLEAVRALRSGEVVTYGEVAALAGRPGAGRAVGAVMAAGHDGVPWWRVVTANGRLVPGHEAEHARRLRREGVVVKNGRVSSFNAVVVALLLSLLAACGGGKGSGTQATSPPPEPIVYVAVGASDSVGVGATDPATEAWPVVLLHTLPKGSRFTNVAVSGSTTEQALSEQVPKAVALDPDLVTVWLNVNDLRALVTPERYGEQLRTLVHQLRRGGETEVLVANTPELDSLPAIAGLGIASDLIERQVDRYNEVIEDVVGDEGAVLVDLHEPSEEAEQDGTFRSLVGTDGFHPSTAGHAKVAASFAEALEDAGGVEHR